MSLPTVAELVKGNSSTSTLFAYVFSIEDQRVVVTLNTHDSVSTALSKLANYNITSAPVIADDGKFHGLVDVVDLLLFLIRVCTKEQKSNVTPPSSKLTTDDLGIISRRSGEFYLTSLFEVLSMHLLKCDTYNS
jgi:CBS domain-containing protein